MTNSQKIQLRLSEVRQRLNALAGQETLTEAEQAEADKLTGEYNTLEVQHRAALVGEGEHREERQGAPQELLERVELRNYLHEAATSRPVQGAEAELRQEMFGKDSREGLIPWELLLPALPERRQDVVTQAPSTVGAVQQGIIPRVFAESVMAFMGVAMPSVPLGTQVYSVLSGGVTGAMQLPDGEQDAEAATFAVETLAPVRLTARYLLRVEDLSRMRGLEDTLRSDLRMALQDAMELQVLTGNGTAPNVNGFFNELAAPAATPSTLVSFADLLAVHASAIDGLYAASLADVRLLVGPETYRRASGILTASGDLAATAYLTVHSGGLRAGYHVPDTDASSKDQQALTYATRGAGSAVAPVWEGVELIRDPYTSAASGRVAITALALWNFKIVREAPYLRHYVQVRS